MTLLRKLELASGVVTAVLAIIMMILNLRIEYAAAQVVPESTHTGKAFAIWFAVFGLPGLLMLSGAYAHAARTHPWGRIVLITATLFLIAWFSLTLVLVVWSGTFLPATLLIGFALLTSIVSLFVRREA